jgi:hypothetical protein
MSWRGQGGGRKEKLAPERVQQHKVRKWPLRTPLVETQVYLFNLLPLALTGCLIIIIFSFFRSLLK